MCSTCIAQTADVHVEWWDLGVIDEMIIDSNNIRDVFDSIMVVPDIMNWSQQKFSFCTVFLSPCHMRTKALLSSWDRLDICISHLCGISRGLSTCTGQSDEFCMGSGEGYSVGSPSLPRGSIYHQSPVSPPELFSRISNSYKCCLGPLQTSHFLRNDQLNKGVKNSSQKDFKLLSNVRLVCV